MSPPSIETGRDELAYLEERSATSIRTTSRSRRSDGVLTLTLRDGVQGRHQHPPRRAADLDGGGRQRLALRPTRRQVIRSGPGARPTDRSCAPRSSRSSGSGLASMSTSDPSWAIVGAGITEIRPMSESPYMSCLRVWVAVAWADGVIAPAGGRGAAPPDRAGPDQGRRARAARGWLDQPVELDTEYVSGSATRRAAASIRRPRAWPGRSQRRAAGASPARPPARRAATRPGGRRRDRAHAVHETQTRNP